MDAIRIEIAATRDAYRAGMARLYELGLQQVLGNDSERIDHDTGEVVERRYVVSFAEVHIPLTIRQRGFLHAAVLPQIAEQVVVEGVRFTPQTWKKHLKSLFLPVKWEMRREMVVDKATGRLRLAKRATPHKVEQHTEDLGIRAYSLFIDQCIDHATAEWGVVFVFKPTEREAVRYKRPARKVKAQQGEAVEA